MDWKLEVVVLPVSDVDRAKKFYSEQVGFNVDVDQEMGESRIVQMTPKGSGCSVTIGRGLNDATPGSVKGMQLCVGDIEAARAELVARGVEVSPIRHVGPEGWADGNGGEWNAFIFFDDPDGNSWAVQESPTLPLRGRSLHAGRAPPGRGLLTTSPAGPPAPTSACCRRPRLRPSSALASGRSAGIRSVVDRCDPRLRRRGRLRRRTLEP